MDVDNKEEEIEGEDYKALFKEFGVSSIKDMYKLITESDSMSTNEFVDKVMKSQEPFRDTDVVMGA